MRDFQHTVNVLVQAYINDTLTHGDCTACAVGNIIKACGYQFDLDQESIQPTHWLRLLQNKHRRRFNSFSPEEAEKQISITGYSSLELNEIELAFEKIRWKEDSYSGDDRMFKSLMAVVDVLAEIHNVDITAKESAKALFVKA